MLMIPAINVIKRNKMFKKLIPLLLLSIITLANARDEGNFESIKGSPTYACNQKVTLKGMLVKRVGEEIHQGQEFLTYFPALALITPISLKAGSDEACDDIHDVGTLHLALDEKQMAIYKQHIGQIVNVHCSLDIAMTAHHHEPIMCFDAVIEK